MGGATGTLLLAMPGGAFARIVPWLIGVASLGVLLKRRTEHFCFDAREPECGRLTWPRLVAFSA
jgi:hypothetical protein